MQKQFKRKAQKDHKQFFCENRNNFEHEFFLKENGGEIKD